MPDCLDQGPTDQHAYNFVEVLESAKQKKNALLTGHLFDYEAEIRDTVFSHEFYIWLSSKRKFNRVLKYLFNKKRKLYDPEKLKADIAYCVAVVYPEYWIFSFHPELLKGTTEAARLRTQNHVNALLDLFDSD